MKEIDKFDLFNKEPVSFPSNITRNGTEVRSSSQQGWCSRPPCCEETVSRPPTAIPIAIPSGGTLHLLSSHHCPPYGANCSSYMGSPPISIQRVGERLAHVAAL